MNILYISHEMDLGGATRSLLGLIDEMIVKRHKIFVLVPKREGNLIEELKKKDVKIIYGRYYSWMSNSKSIKGKIKSIIKFLFNKLSLFYLTKKISSYKIDVVHTNTLIINIGAYLSNNIRAIHVWHIREFGEADHALNFSFNETKAKKFINENSDKVIVISKALLKNYELYIEKDKLQLIYNGVSKNYLQKKESTNKGIINILISGSLQVSKGQEEAIFAARILMKKNIANFILTIAGRGPQEYTKKLHNLVKDNNLENQVKFCGYINNINHLRRSMDIELVCSRSEAFGRVSVEAMMSMNPVIATDTGANPELIKSNFNGFLYTQGDHNDLANKIQLFIQNPDLIYEYGRNGYKYARENFTSEKNANYIENVYKKLLEKSV